MNRIKLSPWLRFFRVVNLPTVPGDVLVGAAAVVASGRLNLSGGDIAHVVLASVASCALYMFGLADNDIVGAATENGRPIPDGEISPRAAKTARATCLVLGLLSVAAVGALPLSSGLAVLTAVCSLVAGTALVAVIVAYNRTKRPFLMGVCRGLNVVLGVTMVAPLLLWLRVIVRAPLQSGVVAAVIAVWTAYIAAVTKYSEGEEHDPARRRRVGLLVGGIVYLQLVALIAFTLINPAIKPLLIAGAVLLVLLRVMRCALPKVSAS